MDGTTPQRDMLRSTEKPASAGRVLWLTFGSGAPCIPCSFAYAMQLGMSSAHRRVRPKEVGDIDDRDDVKAGLAYLQTCIYSSSFPLGPLLVWKLSVHSLGPDTHPGGPRA